MVLARPLGSGALQLKPPPERTWKGGLRTAFFARCPMPCGRPCQRAKALGRRRNCDRRLRPADSVQVQFRSAGVSESSGAERTRHGRKTQCSRRSP
jgi:hypothetical protein